MRTVLILSSAAMIAALNACGKSDAGGRGGEDANDGGGAAVSGDVAEFTTACLASSNLQRPICECAGRKAKAELTDDGSRVLRGQRHRRAQELGERHTPCGTHASSAARTTPVVFPRPLHSR